MRARLPGPLRRLRAAVRGLLGRAEPPPDPPWLEDAPSLVPLGPPRRPRPSAAAAVEPPADPDPLEYPTETEAFGPELDRDDDEDDEAGRYATGSR